MQLLNCIAIDSGLTAFEAVAVDIRAEILPVTAPTTSAAESAGESRGCVDDSRGKWFRDAKFGAFIHFGPYSQLGGYWRGPGPFLSAGGIKRFGGSKRG